MNVRSPQLPKVRRWPWRLALIFVGVLFVVGPWPVDDSGWDGSAYQARTLGRLDRVTDRIQPPSTIRVGVAEVDLTPESPRPLAGFIGQIRSPFVGVDTPCLARALTVASESKTVTILTADLLLINAKLAREVRDRAGVRSDEVYFTSSHTHGGPGGWGDHPLEMLAAGAYDPRFFDELAGKLARVVRRSRRDLEPAELGFVQVQATGRQTNRVDRGAPTHDALSALIFRPVGSVEGSKPIAIFTVFGAHATVSHPVPPRLGGDYPAALVATLKQKTGARSVLFASGAVGDASPSRPKAKSSSKSAEILGSQLAGDLMTALPSARFERKVDLANLRLLVDLPPVRLPMVTSWLRLSPVATWWIVDRQTHLHAVRIGPAVLVGFPGDYSGHLADRLVEASRSQPLSIVATSFDGDYRGYLVSSRVFREIPCYETRLMNFYGPGIGDYLNDTARRMVARMVVESARVGSTDRPMAVGFPRLSLAVLLAMGIVVGRRSLGRLAMRVGVETLMILVVLLLDWELDPDALDWSSFGEPDWLRIAGTILGFYGIWVVRAKPDRGFAAFGFGSGLLTANWLVVLLIVRGWLRAGLSDRPKAAKPARKTPGAASSLRTSTDGLN